MGKAITTLGILLIVTILISGSAMAAWVWVTWIDEEDTSNTDNIDGAPDTYVISLGQDGTPPVLGWVLVDLGSGNEMPPSQDFRVVAQSSVEEDYDVFIGITSDVPYMQYVGSGIDTRNETFTTPASPPTGMWRYILLQGQSGVTGALGGDHEYGPDIDAVGWDKP